MREIKYRFWDSITGEMWEDVWFDLAHVYTGWDEDGERPKGVCPRDDDYLMQYTGLKGRGGAEIYEGDIIEDQSGNLWEVCFDMGQFLLRNNIVLSTPITLYEEPIKTVRGNIYENPGLLKGLGGGGSNLVVELTKEQGEYIGGLYREAKNSKWEVYYKPSNLE